MFHLQTACLHELCQKYSEDIRGLFKSVIRSLLRKFIEVEIFFQSKTFEKNVKDIMLKVNDLEKTLDMIVSHRNLENKNLLVTQILTLVSKKDAEMIAELEEEIKTIASMRFSPAALTARQVGWPRKNPKIDKIFHSGPFIQIGS